MDNPPAPEFSTSTPPQPSAASSTHQPTNVSTEQIDSLPEPLKILVTVITSLVDAMQNARNAHVPIGVRAPDTFEGTDPEKLSSFLFQCFLYFEDNPSVFKNERNKVTFALSYLRGPAQEWFMPNYLDKDAREESPYFQYWEEFTSVLHRQFGHRDPQDYAESQIMRLRLRDNQRIRDYDSNFLVFAHRTGWDDRSLRCLYYKGLPDRLKNSILLVGKPDKLHQMSQLALRLDNSHWELRTDISRQMKMSRLPPQSLAKRLRDISDTSRVPHNDEAPDIQELAEAKISLLQMQDKERIVKYSTEFSRLASRTTWCDRALTHFYYDGLPLRLKERIAIFGKPDTFSSMKDLASRLDASHWEFEAETSEKNPRKTTGGSGNGNDEQSPPSRPLCILCHNVLPEIGED